MSEVVDPLEALREECKQTSGCQDFVKKLEDCGTRQSKTNESCEEEFIDLLECADKCLAPKLFSHLK
ncbi:Ubiquinol cytochrome c oxidoreductase subunit 6 [Fasciolopsis buskii]|uniref:Ubiquinol cytochrome c oxidoreductase subunit 6 n=1 Tax=Fasciolopsis buskii TaxID=27845 RepID=A0A8E0VIX1_9TREM|nr:Ubiquinol cytochrome c oxidoreductase subunit 6 [Fasciolopsis buski]